MSEETHIACAQVAETMRRIYARRLTSTSGGNVSMRHEGGNRVWITAASVDKGEITPEDVSLISLEGNPLSGPPPSSEWPFHVAIYRARPDIRAIVHAHSPQLVAYSLVASQLDTQWIASCHEACGTVVLTDYVVPGTSVLGQVLAKAFSQGCECVLMQNHGIVIGGDTLALALSRLEILEATARSIAAAHELGGLRSLPAQIRVDVKPPPAANDHAPLGSLNVDEMATAAELLRFVHRSCRQQLMQMGRGRISVRSDSHPTRMIATCEHCDFELATADNLVVHEFADADADLATSPPFDPDSLAVHASIYAEHPTVRAVIYACPVYGTALSLVDWKRLPVTIPESYIVLGEVPIIDPHDQEWTPGLIVESFERDYLSAVIAHSGLLVTGRSLLQAFDRLEVLESTAEAIVRATRLGGMTPLSDESIHQLTPLVRRE
jgi:L-fuculose-phosphate aldolase